MSTGRYSHLVNLLHRAICSFCRFLGRETPLSASGAHSPRRTFTRHSPPSEVRRALLPFPLTRWQIKCRKISLIAVTSTQSTASGQQHLIFTRQGALIGKYLSRRSERQMIITPQQQSAALLTPACITDAAQLHPRLNGAINNEPVRRA
jgi:hypothetical protein